MFRRGNRPQKLIPAHAMWGFTRPVARSDLCIPGTLVICSDGLFDRRVPNDNKAPMLHIAATRAAHSCLQNLPDQRLWHRVRLQSPHRASRLNNFEQIGGARQRFDHGFLLAVTQPSCSLPNPSLRVAIMPPSVTSQTPAWPSPTLKALSLAAKRVAGPLVKRKAN